MTFDAELTHFWRTLLQACCFILLAGCAGKEVLVQGSFPSPLIDPLPVSLGIILPNDFRQHEVFDEAKGRAESNWLVKTGEAQVIFWDTLLKGMFSETIYLNSWDDVKENENNIDAVLVPTINDLQYAIPRHTNVKIYEIWMRYEFKLVNVKSLFREEDNAVGVRLDDRLATWPITAYGKTPTAFLQSDEEAVNLAAVVALRDAGAHFITSFLRVPEVSAWFQSTLGTKKEANKRDEKTKNKI